MKRKMLSIAMAIMLTVLIVPTFIMLDTEIAYAGTIAQFTADSRWANGTSWGAGQRPKIANYSSSGCCAYCADYVKYCYGVDNPRSGTAFVNASEIRAGDVIYISGTGGDHWFVVTGRSGNSLSTAEGNYSSKVKVASYYYVNGNKLGGDANGRQIVTGWHYSGATTHTHSWSSWVTSKYATCTADGSKYRTCACGAKETQTIAKLGHSYGSYTTTKEATCIESGTNTRTCSRCGNKETQTIAKLGHLFTNACDTSCNRKGCTYTRKIQHSYASKDWKYVDKLPTGVNSTEYEIQYNNLQTKDAESSPGTGWAQGAGTTKYVNSGNQYDSLGIPLTTSDTRVLVKYSYYHYCGNSTGAYANFAMTGGYNHWDAITDPNSVTIAQTGIDGDDSRYTWYVLKWKSNGQYAYCHSGTTCDGSYGSHGNRSYAWYRVYTYQDKVKKTTYKWTKESGWTSKKDSSASSVKIRYRLRNYKLTAATPTSDGKITTKCEICGEENATLVIPRIDSKSVTLKSSNIVVKDIKGKYLTPNDDYSVVQVSDNGTFDIDFCGNYSGKIVYTNKDVDALKVKSLKLTAGKKKITAKWAKTSKTFDSYQIRYGTKESMSNAKIATVTSKKATSKALTKLKANKKYYVQVRRCKLINGYECYSPWSAKKSVKTK